MKQTKKARRLLRIAFHASRDVLVFVLSIAFAVLIIESDAIPSIARALGEWSVVAVLFSGFFFTSLATVAPAAAALAEFSHTMPLLYVATIGAAGSVVADLVLFRVVRDHVGADISFLLKHSGFRRLKVLRQTQSMRRVLSVLGALIIASPLPDEIGIALMGSAHMGTARFILIAYGMNFMGIAIVAALARGLM